MPTKSRTRGLHALPPVLHALGATVLAAMVTLVAVVALATPSSADVTWSVVPADANGPDGRRVIDIELAGGQQTTEHIAVINRSTQPVDFAIDANDGYLTSKGYFDMRPSDAKPVDGGAWIEIPDKVTIAAGATTVVPVKVTIPQNATPGDHPAGVTASVDTVSGQVRVQNRVGVRLNIRVSGAYVAKVAVSDVKAEYTWSWNPFTAGSVEVTYTVANIGNVRLAPDSRILTSTLTGESGWNDTSDAKAREIMPGGSRTFTAHVTGAWPMGVINTTVMAIPSPAGQPLPGVTAERVSIDTSVWALPWPQLAVLALLALLVVALRITSARRRKRIEKLILSSQGRPLGA
ncbi:WxL protein peptidoglycan domain-containing protein [Microbispora sp. NPDC004025]